MKTNKKAAILRCNLTEQNEQKLKNGQWIRTKMRKAGIINYDVTDIQPRKRGVATVILYRDEQVLLRAYPNKGTAQFYLRNDFALPHTQEKVNEILAALIISMSNALNASINPNH